jgi:hypothetical protein
MNKWKSLLLGGDLRSIGQSNEVVRLIASQANFDAVFAFLFDGNRILVMRAADALEKCTINHPEYLAAHKKELLQLSTNVTHIELKWHLALFISRLHLSPSEADLASAILFEWLSNKKESKIVRVNSLQLISDLSKDNPELKNMLFKLLPSIVSENIPSLNARIKKLKLL